MVDSFLPGPTAEMGVIETGLTLVLNPSHITPSTATMMDAWTELEPGEQPIGVADTGFGWFMPCLHLVEQDYGIPRDLRAVVDFSQMQGCSFLLLDRDGPEAYGLDRHDW